MKLKIIAISAMSILGVLTSIHANATNIQSLGFGTVTVSGSVLSFGPTAGAWTVDAFAGSSECLRFDVSSEFTDLELVIVAPNGTVYRNDDRNGALDRRPLVKINGTPNNGWYTVHLASFNGAPATGNFTLLYSRAPLNSSLCSGSTTPFSALSAPTPENFKDQSDLGPVAAPKNKAAGGL
jgi:hypothetical protein